MVHKYSCLNIPSPIYSKTKNALVFTDWSQNNSFVDLGIVLRNILVCIYVLCPSSEMWLESKRHYSKFPKHAEKHTQANFPS